MSKYKIRAGTTFHPFDTVSRNFARTIHSCAKNKGYRASCLKVHGGYSLTLTKGVSTAGKYVGKYVFSEGSFKAPPEFNAVSYYHCGRRKGYRVRWQKNGDGYDVQVTKT